jgi:MinD superfamily P-loop ATPase
MIISVASGKGGTGKTTIATNLALSHTNVQFFDCDVEEPNANIFFKAPTKTIKNVTVRIPKIVKNKCTYCGKCADFCVYHAIASLPSATLVFPELCHGCGGCAIVCDQDAVDWQYRTTGIIEKGVTNGVEVYQGLLNIGETQAIPVIRALKQYIDPTKTVILDAPPGTACPVIETIKDSDFCILVTEPTPFGLHDLKLAIAVVRQLSIPFGVIINRNGIGDKKVEQYCHNENIPLLLKIPHSNKIAQLYSNGIPFIHENHNWQTILNELYNRIQQEVNASNK